MKRTGRKQRLFERILLMGIAALCLSWLLVLGACSHPAPTHNEHAGHAATAAPQAKVTPRIPDHFTSAEAAKPLTQTLDPRQFSVPYVVKAYQLAKEIPEVLAQQPCYCNCDLGF